MVGVEGQLTKVLLRSSVLGMYSCARPRYDEPSTADEFLVGVEGLEPSTNQL